ncbi:MAG: hypothetical protein WDM86_02005 [Rhizomicrobium sp.]
MSKIGVGVGDEFPLDDGAAKSAAGETPRTPEDDRAEFEEWKRRRDAWRAQREAWRAQREEWRRRRHEWKEQWRAQRRQWRDEYRDGPEAGPYGHPFFFGRGPWRVVGTVAAVALIVFALSHIGYIIVGLAALALLFAAYHHFGHDPLDIGPRDYARPVTTPPPAPQTSVEKPRDPAEKDLK